MCSKVHGMAGRQVNVNQSKLDNGFVVLEIQSAQGGHCASVVLTPKGADQLAEIMAKQAQKAREMAVTA